MKKLRTFLLSAMLLYIVSSYAQTPNNILQTSSWYTNTGSVGSVGYFTANGGSGQNSIIWGVDPFNKKSLLWQSISDGNNGPNGGWNCYNLPIDHTKAYRLTAWFKKGTAPTTGNFYFGCDGNGNTLNLDNTTNYNPYFGAYGNNNFTAGKWYLWVGYIHASSDGDNNSYGGIYDGETGQKLFDLTDYKMAVGAIYQMHRAYNFYDQQVGATAYWYAPRFEEINGSEPSVEQLLGTVGQAATNNKIAYAGANMGVGIGTPENADGWQKVLQVHGAQSSKLMTSTNNVSAGLYAHDYGFYGALAGGIAGTTSNHAFSLMTNKTARLTIAANGNVGINTTTPSDLFSVNGNIRSRKVIVTQTGWPDYVFDSSYQLPSLDSVSTFIQVNKHLPDMPSAATVEKDGHDLGEMQKMLLKKVEELTLYVIQQQKEIDNLKAKVAQQEEKK